jgi:hypothetical protein
MEKTKTVKMIATILLALAGIGTMGFYVWCDTSCRYLQGDIWGIDMKYIGIGYMLAILALTIFRQTGYVRFLLAGGVGSEIYLFAYQVAKGVFCPFCLLFAAVVVIAFVVNHEKPMTVCSNPLKKITYAFGDVEMLPFFKIRIPLLAIVFLAYLFILLTFSGSTTPAYAAEKPLVPSYGSGSYELIVFTDYFCHPCQVLESELDPALSEIFSRGGVKITFVDLPVHTQTRLFAKYFLYVSGVTHQFKDILSARKVLFTLAKDPAISDDASLAKALSAKGVTFAPQHDLKEIYEGLNRIIKKHAITRTPTCVVKYSDSDIRTYSGANEIRSGLAMLRATQNTMVKKKQ